MDGKENGIIRQRIVFNGWVQGVGFRYRAYHAASSAGATGWVKNNYDGSVTMEIQGTRQQIDSVILALNRGTYIRIEDMSVSSLSPDEDERTFRIK